LIAGWTSDGTLRDAMQLAAGFSRELHLEPTGSSLVCVPVTDVQAARAALEAARVKAAIRGDGIRFSVHVWNGPEDVERAVTAITPYLRDA
jgi:hypothetical protein